jgi:hypothetical protein
MGVGGHFSTLDGVVWRWMRRAAERGAFRRVWGRVEGLGCPGCRRSDFLFWLAIEHNWFHLGEIWVIRTLLPQHPLS